MSLQGVATGVWVGVPFVLADLHSFDEFSEGGSVSGSVFTDDADFLGSFGHFDRKEFLKMFENLFFE